MGKHDKPKPADTTKGGGGSRENGTVLAGRGSRKSAK